MREEKKADVSEEIQFYKNSTKYDICRIIVSHTDRINQYVNSAYLILIEKSRKKPENIIYLCGNGVVWNKSGELELNVPCPTLLSRQNCPAQQMEIG